MPTPLDNLTITPPPQPSYGTLRTALNEAEQGLFTTEAQSQALEELRLCRSQVSQPLSSTPDSLPNPSDRQRLSGLANVTITITDRLGPPSLIRLGADLVSVALALSDDLQLNELHAAALLYDARSHAALRPDHDVVVAAKELFYARRRQQVLYLQDVLRAALVPRSAEDAFIVSLVKERDALVVDHQVFENVAKRLEQALSGKALQKGEGVLLAETLFLLAYTVQLNSADALTLRKLLDNVQNALANVGNDAKVEMESVRNVLLLTWMCALDRSRYHDVYDPRTGAMGVNLLLKDLAFVQKTSDVPQLAENEDDGVSKMGGARAAAELCGALFRMAVASPDENEAVTTALRTCAYGGALKFLGGELAKWIAKGAGSLCPDSDLYADVLEDLALDLAEAPQLVSSLVSFTQNEVYAAASQLAYASLDTGGGSRNVPPSPRGGGGGMRSSFAPKTEPGSARRLSGSTGGKPPRPPGMRGGTRGPNGGTEVKKEKSEEVKLNGSGGENLIASLATMIAQAVSLAPSKLGTNSLGGGARYWSGLGGSGVVQQLGDAVIDLWDASMRNAYAPGGVGDALRESLSAFLNLLAAMGVKEGTPTHASSALAFLRDSGQGVASLERASEAMAYFNSQLGGGVLLDEADVEALGGIVRVVANAATGLREHGGVMLVLGEAGRELVMRMAALAVHDMPVELRANLISGVREMRNGRAISGLLENLSGGRCGSLRHFLRAVEGGGEYQVTVSVLEMVKDCVQGSEFPEGAVENLVLHFAIDEVLGLWSRRQYRNEAARWRVIAAATEVILQVVMLDPEHERAARMLGSLLKPAPGTGAACSALRAILFAAGLMADEEGICGRDALLEAVASGDGEGYREMLRASQSAARLIRVVVSVPVGKIAGGGNVVASGADLMMGDSKALQAASSLVLAVDEMNNVQIGRAGWNGCAAALGMLAAATHESMQIAAVIVRNGGEFRKALADLIASATERSVLEEGKDPPVMYSVLRIVEACLGDGGAMPGLFLLGIQLDSMGAYCTEEYGVLGALVEVLGGGGRLDCKARSTSAMFLYVLASCTVRGTSLAVLEYLRDVTEVGVGEEMLKRILGGENKDAIDWNVVGELVTACMGLNALQVRVFKKEGENVGGVCLIELLKLLGRVHGGSGNVKNGLNVWCQLVGVRLGAGQIDMGVLKELVSILLGALGGGGGELSGLVRSDGSGKMVASVVLACVQKMRAGQAEMGGVLNGIVGSLANMGGVTADACIARTNLYATLLLLNGEDDSCLNTNVGGRGITGSEVLIISAVGDALEGGNAAIRSCAMGVLGKVVQWDNARGVSLLSCGGRLRRVLKQMQDTELKDALRGGGGKAFAAKGIVEGGLGLMHAVASGGGGRVLVDGGGAEILAGLVEVCEGKLLQKVLCALATLGGGCATALRPGRDKILKMIKGVKDGEEEWLDSVGAVGVIIGTGEGAEEMREELRYALGNIVKGGGEKRIECALRVLKGLRNGGWKDVDPLAGVCKELTGGEGRLKEMMVECLEMSLWIVREFVRDGGVIDDTRWSEVLKKVESSGGGVGKQLARQIRTAGGKAML